MWSQHSMMTCITVLLALKLPVSDRAVQSSGSLLKAELDCSDTIFFILSKVPQWARWVQTSSSPLVPWLCLYLQAAWVSLLFSGYHSLIFHLFFSLVIFICDYMLGIFWFTKLWLALICLRIKPFSHFPSSVSECSQKNFDCNVYFAWPFRVPCHLISYE